jgi:nitrate reductase (cytochrome), electron transfer subunit
MKHDHHAADLMRRVALIGASAFFMVWLIRAVESAVARRAPADIPEAAVVEVAPVPIAAEAGVFRTRSAPLASSESVRRRSSAHPRTLATFRALRAYPGAPPRIPHGLTSGELRATQCNTCHERGGYVARFAAYAPVTPHPELAACLQCHAIDDAVAGVALPARGPDAVCRQCHDPGRPGVTSAEQPGMWPAAPSAADGRPPVIPHDLELRGDCLACHAGPAAVAEIRTSHPERTHCRQCHVTSAVDEAPFIHAGGSR